MFYWGSGCRSEYQYTSGICQAQALPQKAGAPSPAFHAAKHTKYCLDHVHTTSFLVYDRRRHTADGFFPTLSTAFQTQSKEGHAFCIHVLLQFTLQCISASNLFSRAGGALGGCPQWTCASPLPVQLNIHVRVSMSAVGVSSVKQQLAQARY